MGRRGNLSRQLLNEEKKLEVYTQTGGEEPQVYSYTQQAEDDWEKTEEVWVEERIDVDTYVNYLLRGADDNLYLMTTDIVDTGNPTRLLRRTESLYFRHSRRIVSAYAGGNTGGHRWNVWIWNIRSKTAAFFRIIWALWKNGDVAVVGAATTNIVLYDGATGKENIRCRATRS